MRAVNLREIYLGGQRFEEERQARRRRALAKLVWDEYDRRVAVRTARRREVDRIVAETNRIFNPWTDL